jgi:hypothetical protein
MSDDDYLWNRTGRPDPEVERLEQVLGTLRSARPPVPPPALADERPRARRGLLPWALGLGSRRRRPAESCSVGAGPGRSAQVPPRGTGRAGCSRR